MISVLVPVLGLVLISISGVGAGFKCWCIITSLNISAGISKDVSVDIKTGVSIGSGMLVLV